ncbi:MAG: hypothetical protein IT455_15170 [Planctomycetes bacterium]|nr:hypothetical protein [Planctomycetota bacterium]
MPAQNLRPAPDAARWSLLAVLPALLLMAWQAAWPWPFFSDDAFISLRYVDRLLAGDGLTWTAGERVEGYSNLLWVLLCAGLGAVGLDLVNAARLAGAAATAAAAWCLVRALAPHDRRSCALAAIAPLLVAATQPVLVWTLAGLEGPLVLGLLAWGCGDLVRALAAGPPHTWHKRRGLRLGLPFALLCLVRPDGPLWVFAAGLALLASRRSSCVGVLWLGAPATLAVAAQLTFRVVYYGDVVPNTAHVKAELSAASFGPGLDYVGHALLAMPGLTLLAVLSWSVLVARRDSRPLGLVLMLPVLAWFAYLVAIGGDHFPGRRLLHGALAPLALAVAVVLQRARGARLGIGMLLALAAIGVDATRARSDAQSHEAKHERWEWQGKALGERLGHAFAADRPLLAVDAAGAVPFYSRLPALDLLGLCDRTIATTPFPAWLDTMRPELPRPPGHLRGNGRYVLQRAPDLLLFSSPPGLPLPVFVSGAELEEEARFRDDYRCVLVMVPGLDRPAPLWARLDGRVGIGRDGARLTIPAWWFGSHRLSEPVIRRHQPASTDADLEARRATALAAVADWYGSATAVAVPAATGAGLELELRSTTSALLDLRLARGTWRQIEPPPSRARIVVEGAEAPTASAAFRIDTDGLVRLRLDAGAGDGPRRFTRVVLEHDGS